MKRCWYCFHRIWPWQNFIPTIENWPLRGAIHKKCLDKISYLKVAVFLAALLLPGLVRAQTCVQADLNHPLSAALTWQDNSTNETGFLLERKVGTGAYAVLATGIGANLTAYTDSTVTRGNTYTYRIQALAPAGAVNSPFSNEACITFAAAPVQLQPPAGLTVAAISTSAFRITWEDIQGEAGYSVEGKEARGNQSFVQVANLLPDTANYDWTGRKRYTPYCVRIKASNAGAPYSSIACATTVK